MRTKEETEKSERLEVYHLEEEIMTYQRPEKIMPSDKMFCTKSGKRIIRELENLEKHHNHSWYKELRQRACKNPCALALFYRGNKITFEEMFQKADQLSKALVGIGIKAGDEIPVCMANVPETVYLMLAVNRLGAKINFFGENLDKNYLQEILRECSNSIFFATDDVYGKIQDKISGCLFEYKVIISLADSMPEKPEETDEYNPKLKEYYHFENKLEKLKKKESDLLDYVSFIKKANIHKLPEDIGKLDTDFLITYTSGSTKIGMPKQIIHRNRSLIAMGRFHDAELSGNPEIKDLRALAHIHTDSNTNLITSISDSLMQLWAVALEPEYDETKMLDYIQINKPNYLCATTSFWLSVAKQYFERMESGKIMSFPFLLAAFAVGEGVSKGEEQFINRFLRVSKAGSGVKIKGFSIPYTTLCLGGGDCEHGGIYYTLFRSIQTKLHRIRLHGTEYGMKPVPFAHVAVFRPHKNGIYRECKYNEIGLLAANSVSTMAGYKGNAEATKKLLITDERGREWVSANVYGYIDSLGSVHVKGRANGFAWLMDKREMPDFAIEDLICEDFKNILSCSISHVGNEEQKLLVANIELQPFHQKTEQMILKSLGERCGRNLPKDYINRMYIRKFDSKHSFPLTISGKRSIRGLEEMEIENTIWIGELYDV